MSDYAVIRPNYWKRGTGKRLRGKKDAQILSFYLMSAPANKSMGIYSCEIEEMVLHTGLTEEEVLAALPVLEAEDFAHYDHDEELVWVPNMARNRFGETLAPKDKKRSWIAKELTKMKGHRFVEDFVRRYAEGYGLEMGHTSPTDGASGDGEDDPPAPKRTKSKGHASPTEAPSKGVEEGEDGASRPSEGTSYPIAMAIPIAMAPKGVQGETGSPPRNLRTALEVPLAERAARVVANPHDGEHLEPQRWPEVVQVAQALHEASGQTGKPRLLGYARDSGVRAVVELFAAEYPLDAVIAVAKALPKTDYWRNSKSRMGLASLTAETVRRQLADLQGPTKPAPSASDIERERVNMASRKRRQAEAAANAPPGATPGSVKSLLAGIGVSG